MTQANKLTLSAISPTKPLTKLQRNYLGNMINRSLAAGAGNNDAFRLSVGDRVEDFIRHTPASDAGTVEAVYRENGHNKVTTNQGNFRERDLRVKL